jgi:hypothetical protein
VLLQVAIDRAESIGVIAQVRGVADTIEIGTPLLKRFGIGAISTARELCSDTPISRRHQDRRRRLMEDNPDMVERLSEAKCIPIGGRPRARIWSIQPEPNPPVSPMNVA